jgi:hypothetical protein
MDLEDRFGGLIGGDFGVFALAPQVLFALDKIGAGSFPEILVTGLAVVAARCVGDGDDVRHDVAKKIVECYNGLPLMRAEKFFSNADFASRIHQIARKMNDAFKEQTEYGDDMRAHTTNQRELRSLWEAVYQNGDAFDGFAATMRVVKEKATGAAITTTASTAKTLTMTLASGESKLLNKQAALESELPTFTRLAAYYSVTLSINKEKHVVLSGEELAVKVLGREISATLRAKGLLTTYSETTVPVATDQEIKAASSIQCQLGLSSRVISRDTISEELTLEQGHLSDSLKPFFQPQIIESAYESITTLPCFARHGDADAHTKVLSRILNENKKSDGGVQIYSVRWPSKKKWLVEEKSVLVEKEARAKRESEGRDKRQRKDGLPPSDTMVMGVSVVAMQELQINHDIHSREDARGHDNFLVPLGFVQALPGTEAKHGKDRSRDDSDVQLGESFEHILTAPLPYSLESLSMTEGVEVCPEIMRKWFYDLLKIASHCHKNAVMLKSVDLQNIAIAPSGSLKLISLANTHTNAHLADVKDFSGLDCIKIKPDSEENSWQKNDWKKLDTMDKRNASTRPFTAPELLLGAEMVTTRTDSWYLCNLVATMLLGKKLFGGKNRTETLQAIFKVVGSVSDENFPKGRQFPMYKPTKGDKKYKPGVSRAIRDMLERKGRNYAGFEGLIEVLEKGLVLDPNARAGVDDLLGMDFFKGIEEGVCLDNFIVKWLELRAEVAEKAERGCLMEETLFSKMWLNGGHSMQMIQKGDKLAIDAVDAAHLKTSVKPTPRPQYSAPPQQRYSAPPQHQQQRQPQQQFSAPPSSYSTHDGISAPTPVVQMQPGRINAPVHNYSANSYAPSPVTSSPRFRPDEPTPSSRFRPEETAKPFQAPNSGAVNGNSKRVPPPPPPPPPSNGLSWEPPTKTAKPPESSPVKKRREPSEDAPNVNVFSGKNEVLTCSECSNEFNFEVQYQVYLSSKGLSKTPKRCKDCIDSSKRNTSNKRDGPWGVSNHQRSWKEPPSAKKSSRSAMELLEGGLTSERTSRKKQKN